MARSRITADVSDEVRRALLILAAERDCPIGELVEAWVQADYPDHVRRATEVIAALSDKPKTRGKPPAKPRP